MLKASCVIAVCGNRGQEFAQHFFGGDEQSIRTVRGACGLRPCVAGYENGKPINGIDENLPHRFGVPYA